MADTYPADVEAYEERPRRGRRLFVMTIVFLIVVAGLLVVADRAAVGFAERAVADQVRQEVAKQKVQSSSPDVTVGGFPFLTQVVAGRYESISILLRDVRGAVDGESVSLPELDINARDVSASIDTLRSGQGEVRAETVEGTATISYDSVAKLIDRPGLRLAERDGKLVMAAPLKILGKEFTLNGTAKLAVSDKGEVRVRFDELTAEGLPPIPAAQSLVSAYAKQISINIPLPALPFKLVLQEVRALPEGLALTATAKDVPLNSVT